VPFGASFWKKALPSPGRRGSGAIVNGRSSR
jgi:hypothetical protein